MIKIRKLLDLIIVLCITIKKELFQGKTVERRWRKTKGVYSTELKSASCRFAG